MGVRHIFSSIFGLLVTLVVAVEPANILGVFTSHSPSHQIVHMAYVKALIERGHNVTVVTTIPLKDKNPRYHHIVIPQTEARTKFINENKILMKDPNPKTVWQFLDFAVSSLKIFGPVQYDAIKSQQFQELMNNPGNKFDLVILGYFFSDYHLGLGEHFKCPIVISLTSGMNDFVDRYVGNPSEIAYVPNILSLGKSDSTSFFGRLQYFYSKVMTKILVFTMDREFSEFYNDLFPASKYPSIEEAAKRVSLVLSNSHLSEGIIRPNVPGVIEVGGIQIKERPDPLPKNLQEIIESTSSSKHGVVYLSFGSNLGSKDFSAETIQNIYKVLSNLKQTVLWKWDSKDKPGNSPNIHFMQWLPQDDLLAHPNVKLFITHCGKGSVAEAQFHGVPMVAVPIFADQPANAKKLVEDGFGLQLDTKTMTEESIRATVLEVLENPKYTENVRRFATLYRDRPMSPKQTAMFWIEYVIRHKGAYHMQSPAVHLNVFQYLSLDVIGFLLLITYLVYKLLTISVKWVFRKIFLKSNSKKEKTKKQ